MPETIEAEVIEIDGVEPPKAEKSEKRTESPWSRAGMQGRVLKLDRRWWPLWLLLGVVAVILAATVGVVLGICYTIFAVIRRVLRGIFGGMPSGGSGSGALRRD